MQPTGDPANFSRTNEESAEQLLDIARVASPRLWLVKLGCPGETTVTMIAGGICSYDHGSQLDEAVAFLRAHRSFVAFVTIDIGANDFPCQGRVVRPARRPFSRTTWSRSALPKVISLALASSRSLAT